MKSIILYPFPLVLLQLVAISQNLIAISADGSSSGGGVFQSNINNIYSRLNRLEYSNSDLVKDIYELKT